MNPILALALAALLGTVLGWVARGAFDRLIASATGAGWVPPGGLMPSRVYVGPFHDGCDACWAMSGWERPEARMHGARWTQRGDPHTLERVIASRTDGASAIYFAGDGKILRAVVLAQTVDGRSLPPGHVDLVVISTDPSASGQFVSQLMRDVAYDEYGRRGMGWRFGGKALDDA